MEKHEQNGHAESAELDLLALRYVTGEMQADEATAFEERLADDQEARESVSRAVLVGEAVVREPALVAAASAVDAARPSGRWWLAAAAVVLVGVGAGFYLHGVANREAPSEPTAHEQAAEDEASDLIARYVDDLPDRAFAEAGLEASLDTFEAVEGGEVMLDIGTEAPAWMVQALAK